MPDALYKLGADTTPFQKATANMDKGLKGVTKNITAQFKAIGGAIAAAFSVRAIKGITQAADDLATFSDEVGISIDFIQRFQRANIAFGVSTADATKGLEKFAVQHGEAIQGTGQLKKQLDLLNLSLRKENGELFSTEELLIQLMDALAGTTNGALRARIAYASFGRTGAQMSASLGQGADAFKAKMDDAFVASEKTVRSLAEMNADLELNMNNLKQGGAIIFNLFSKIVGAQSRFAGTISGGGNSGEAMLAMIGYTPDGMRNLKKLQDRLNAQIEAKAFKTAEAAAAEKEILALKEKQAAVAEKELERITAIVNKEKERVRKITEQFAARKAAGTAARSSFKDRRTGFTVGGVASGGQDELFNEFGLNAAGRKNKAKIDRIAYLERYASAARFNERPDIVKSASEEADALRRTTSALTSPERNPMITMDATMKKLEMDTAKFHLELLTQGLALRAR